MSSTDQGSPAPPPDGSEARRRPRGFAPASRVDGSLRPPGSKSQAQRALLLGALGDGVTRIEGILDGQDVGAARELAEALGAGVRSPGAGALEVEGIAARPRSGELALVLGESGTLARLATAVVALAQTERVRLIPTGTLRTRTSPPLFQALRAAGVTTLPTDAVGWPVELTPVEPPGLMRLERPVSSQEASGLSMALSVAPGERELIVGGPIPSRPYLDLTLHALERFGVGVRAEAVGGELHLRLRGPVRAPAEPFVVEPDASSAAVALAAGCLSGGAVVVPGLGRSARQGDVRIVEHLTAFGCTAEVHADRLTACGAPQRGARLDLVGEPDLAPVLAAVAAAAADACGATSELVGLATLVGKESDRIAVLAEGLTRCGFAVRTGPDRLGIGPGPDGPRAPSAPLDPHGDHRMAFAFALLGLLREGVRVQDPDCVAKSWPGFWEDLVALGAVESPG